MTDLHSCSYYCDRPECIKAQRDELRERLTQLEQKPEPPPWWPAVENILNVYGLQAIDFVADFKEAMRQADQEPVEHCEAGPEHCPVCHKESSPAQQPEQEPVAWVPVAEALPKSGVKVLACYRNRLGNLRRIRAEWIAAKTQEADVEDLEACSEYDEATDTYFTTEGWYECIDNWGDYSSVRVTEGDVTHWMPLPPDPDTAPPRREWVGLTDEEIMEPWPFEDRVAFARWLEAKLKEKNA